MTSSSVVINQVLPVFLLAGLGQFLKRSGFISPGSVEEIKKLIVNVSLPAVLFLSFMRIEMQGSYLGLSAIIFCLCLCLMGIAKLLQSRLAPNHPYFPFLASGFEYGMLGVGLFASVYGIEKIGYIAVIDLGHELFIWFVMLPLLLSLRDGRGSLIKIIQGFATNPVIIGIVAGLAINGFGIVPQVENMVFTGGIIRSLEFLAELTPPLILLVVGYGIEISGAQIKDVFKLVFFRYLLVIPVILLGNHFVISGYFNLDKPFQVAFFTLFILPSPFIIPLFMKTDMEEEKKYINNILAIQTVITIVIFSLYVIFNPQI